MNYYEQLKDPRWKAKRIEILERDNYLCTECGGRFKELHVHHINYISGLKVWEYPNEFLTTLCKYHHEHSSDHERIKELNEHERIKELNEHELIKKAESDFSFWLWKKYEISTTDFDFTLLSDIEKYEKYDYFKVKCLFMKEYEPEFYEKYSKRLWKKYYVVKEQLNNKRR